MRMGGLHSLLAQAAEGDARAREQALGELLRLLSIFVRAAMGRRLRDHRESEDVCQSIARSFIEDLGTGRLRFENEAAVVGYLRTVVQTKLALLARHDGAAKRGGGGAARAIASPGLESAGESGPPPPRAIDGPTPTATASDDEPIPGRGNHGADDAERALREREAISIVLDRLSAEEQELVRLRMGGVDWEDIGERLGRAPGALRKQWSRLVERVGSELDK